MSALTEKIDKQFEYQQSMRPISELFVSVDHLTRLLMSQVRDSKPKKVRNMIKQDLERRVKEGTLRRWTDVHGASYRADREDHYYLHFKVQQADFRQEEE